jgi:hypothetical protein
VENTVENVEKPLETAISWFIHLLAKFILCKPFACFFFNFPYFHVILGVQKGKSLSALLRIYHIIAYFQVKYDDIH